MQYNDRINTEDRKWVMWLITPLSGGGTETYIRTVIQNFDHTEYKLCVVYGSSSGRLLEFESVCLNHPSSRIVYLPQLNSTRLLFLPAISAFIRLLKNYKPVLVNSIFIRSDLLASIASYFVRDIPLVSSVRGALIPASTSRKNRIFYKSLHSIIARRVISRYITVSSATARDLISDYGVDEKKINVIYNGIDVDTFQTQTENAFKCGTEFFRSISEPLVGVITRLTRAKGVKYFIESIPMILQDYPDVRFAIIGDGPERNQLETIAQSLGLNKKSLFLGWQRDARSAMQALDVVVVPSLAEGMPWTVLEAMAIGKPVVASRVGGVPEIINSPNVGFLVEPGNPNEIANAIIELLRVPKLRTEIGQLAKEHIRLYFSLDDRIQELVSVYKDIVR